MAHKRFSMDAEPGQSIFGTPANDTLHGTEGDDTIHGSDGNDVLYGHGGDDYLSGDGGIDTLDGGAGNDRYVLDHNTDDILVESADGGDEDEIVIGFISEYTLPENFENLTRSGDDGWPPMVMIGNALDNVLLGVDGKETMYGGAGDDFLIAESGGDLLYGEEGNDTLSADDGNDTAWGGVGDDHINGGSGNDSLFGEEGNDTLDGGVSYFGDGPDTMMGGTGDDSYVINEGDTIIENEGEGVDTISFNFYAHSFVLPQNVENLAGALDLLGGRTLSVFGNSLNNVLEISTLNDHDTGQVKAFGGAGNDVITIKTAVVSEVYGQGGNDVLIGNISDDRLNGGAGNDLLVGGGGTDFLTGGAGADEFRFITKWGEFGAALINIEDFQGNLDRLWIRGGLFEGLDTQGPLAAELFHTGTEATAAEQRLIFDSSTGALYYDADGSGAMAQQHIMNITVAGGSFDHTDIVIGGGA